MGAAGRGSRRPGPSFGPRRPGRIQSVVATPRSGGVRMGRPKGWATAATGRPPMRSPGRPPVARREHRQRFWAAIRLGLTSEDAAVVAGVSQPVGTRWFREAGGMPPITRAPLSGRYLSFAEREEIAILRGRGCGVREIARRTARSPSAVSRELRRNAATRGGRWSTGPRRRSGTRTGGPGGRRPRSSPRTRPCGPTCRTGWPARSPGQMAELCRARMRGGPGGGTGGGRPAVGGVVEPGADREPAPGRLP